MFMDAIHVHVEEGGEHGKVGMAKLEVSLPLR
jgi:hypothetical protein